MRLPGDASEIAEASAAMCVSGRSAPRAAQIDRIEPRKTTTTPAAPSAPATPGSDRLRVARGERDLERAEALAVRREHRDRERAVA